MKVLVTGCKGYIGSALVDELIKRDIEHTAYDKDQDVRVPQYVESVIKRDSPDVVIHLAAMTPVVECEQDEVACLNTNVGGTINVFRACHKVGCKLVLASTLAARNPLSSQYAMSKKLAEAVVQSTYGNCTILRLGNVVGGKHNSWTHLVPNLIDSAQNDRPFFLTSTDTSIRDYVDLRDVVDALLHFAVVVSAPMACVDIGTGVGTRVATVLREVEKQMGKTIMTCPGKMRPGEAYDLTANTSFADSFGWSSFYDLADSISYSLRSVIK